MSTISRYIVVPRAGPGGLDDEEFDSFSDARRHAERNDCAVIERTYALEDEDLCWTPDGSSEWPPNNPQWESWP